MNKRKILGFALWLLAFLVPFQPSLLSTDGISNTVGLLSFIAMVALVFAGYILVDAANAAEKAKHNHGH
jgi:hypothetical protein